MFKSLKTMTIHTIDGDELNDQMAADGYSLDPVGYGCVPGGEMRVTVKGDEFSESDLDPSPDAYPPTVIWAYLCRLARDGSIPEGEYRIKYTWG